jgi:hypothetical protein
MTYDEVLATIAGSSKQDWVKDKRGHHWTYKSNLNIRLKDSTHEEFGGDNDYKEPWIDRLGRYPSKRVCFTIYYGNSYLKDVYMVAVDDYGAYIPYPRSAQDLVITRWQYQFAKLVQPFDDDYTLNSYLDRAGIHVAR